MTPQDLNLIQQAKKLKNTINHAPDYLYAILFPNQFVNLQACRRISFSSALSMYLSCVNGGEKRQSEAKLEFEKAWITKFRSAPPDLFDLVPFVFIQELVRMLIIARLEAATKLIMDVRSTKDGSAIVSMFRGTRKVYCNEAQRSNLMVQLCPQIDPSFEYWSNAFNRIKDNKDISREDAQTILYRMFLEGKIGGNEAQIFDDENSYMWTKRINVLWRKLDSSIDTKHCKSTYFPYKTSPRLQHLYHMIPGNNSGIPFRIIDKIRLIKSLINREFSTGKLLTNGFIVSDFCLHSYENYDEDASLDKLQNSWGSYAAIYRTFYMSTIPWKRILSYQPIQDIRNYFGEEIALYFTFVEFFAEKTLWIMALGLLQLFFRPTSTLILSQYKFTFSLMNCLWSILFIRLWQRKENQLAMKWGILRTTKQQSVRPEFKGSLAISCITNREEIYFNPHQRLCMQIISWFLILCSICALVLIIVAIFYAEYILESTHWMYSTLLCHFLLAFMMPLSTTWFSSISKSLNNWENYKTQDDYDRNLIWKFAVFETFNRYFALLFIVFIKSRIYGCKDDNNKERNHKLCTNEVQQLLYVIFFFMLLQSCKEIISSLLHFYYQSKEVSISKFCLLRKDQVESQIALHSYDGVLEAYAQILVLYGYLCLFGCSSPYVSLYIYLLTLLKLRSNAHQLCFYFRRPHPKSTENMEGWEIYLFILSFLSIFVSSGIAIFTSNHWFLPISSTYDPYFYYIVTVCFLGCCWGIVIYSLSSIPQEVSIALKRHEYLQDKHMYGFPDEKDSFPDTLPPGIVLVNGIYRHYITGNLSEETEVTEIKKMRVSLNEERKQQLLLIDQVARASGDQLGKLHLLLNGIQQLPSMESISSTKVNPYIKIRVLSEEKKIPKISFKTTVKHKSRSPLWKEEFLIPLYGVDNIVQLTVYHKEVLIGKDRKIAECRLPCQEFITLQEQTERKLAMTLDPKIEEAHPKEVSILLSCNLKIELTQLGISLRRLLEIKKAIKDYDLKLAEYLEW